MNSLYWVFHILIYCLTKGKSGAENSALLVETCEQSPCRKQPKPCAQLNMTKLMKRLMKMKICIQQVFGQISLLRRL